MIAKQPMTGSGTSGPGPERRRPPRGASSKSVSDRRGHPRDFDGDAMKGTGRRPRSQCKRSKEFLNASVLSSR